MTHHTLLLAVEIRSLMDDDLSRPSQPRLIYHCPRKKRDNRQQLIGFENDAADRCTISVAHDNSRDLSIICLLLLAKQTRVLNYFSAIDRPAQIFASLSRFRRMLSDNSKFNFTRTYTIRLDTFGEDNDRLYGLVSRTA